MGGFCCDLVAAPYVFVFVLTDCMICGPIYVVCMSCEPGLYEDVCYLCGTCVLVDWNLADCWANGHHHDALYVILHYT